MLTLKLSMFGTNQDTEIDLMLVHIVFKKCHQKWTKMTLFGYVVVVGGEVGEGGRWGRE